jgi:phosphate transport system substrate-binding protein
MTNLYIFIAGLSLTLTVNLLKTAVAVQCGPSEQGFVIAGSTTVYQLAQKWAESYMTACDGIAITVEGGGSSSGAARVCGNITSAGGPVDIGDMSRDWFDKEAVSSTNGYLHQCVVGDPTRSAIQIDVAIDGLSIAASKNGTAATCIQMMGGLTTDQLRWIYTNYDADQLLATGWDPEALSNSDDDESTHLWSELDARCPAVEIQIAGPDPDTGTFEYFHQTILVDLNDGETYDADRPGGYYSSKTYIDLVAYTEANGDALSFFAYYLFLNDIDYLFAVPILNDEGDYVLPAPSTVSDGTYNPLSRRIYMNLLNDAGSLDNTRPFLEFAFSADGTSLVNGTGLVPIDESERELLLSQLPEPGESFDIAALPSQEKYDPNSPSVSALPSPSSITSSSTKVYVSIHFNSISMICCLFMFPFRVLLV